MKFYFYTADIFFRFFYSFLSFFCSLGVVFFKKESFLFFLFNLISFDCFYFIATSPSDVFYADLSLSFFVSFIISFHFCSFQFFFFIVDSWYPHERTAAFFTIFSFLFICLVSNLFSFVYIIPRLWHFFIAFNALSSFFTFQYIPHYSQFIYFFLYNGAFLFFFFFLFSFFLFVIIKFNYFFFLFSHRKFTYLFFSFLGGVFSPPDFFSQLFLFFLFSILFEIFIYFCCLFHSYFYN